MDVLMRVIISIENESHLFRKTDRFFRNFLRSPLVTSSTRTHPPTEPINVKNSYRISTFPNLLHSLKNPPRISRQYWTQSFIRVECVLLCSFPPFGCSFANWFGRSSPPRFSPPTFSAPALFAPALFAPALFAPNPEKRSEQTPNTKTNETTATNAGTKKRHRH